MEFYDLSKDYRIKWIEYGDNTDWESIKCPKFKGHQRAGNRIGDLEIEIPRKKIYDFMWTFLSECIITDRVHKLFSKHKFTGYEVRAVKVCNMKSEMPFWEFIVTGSGGEAHPDSGIYLKEYCEYCGDKTYSAYENGITVDESRWDGSDFFTVVGYSRHILVTPRVKDLIVKKKLKNVKFTLSTKLEWPECVIKP